jgi:hypothetical protein
MDLTDANGQLTGTAMLANFVSADISDTRNGASASMSVTGEFLEPGITMSGTFTATTFTGTYSTSSVDSTVELERQ